MFKFVSVIPRPLRGIHQLMDIRLHALNIQEGLANARQNTLQRLSVLALASVMTVERRPAGI